MEEPIITEEIRDSLRDTFKQLKDEVAVLVFTRMGENEPFNERTVELIGELGKVDSRIKVSFHKLGGKEAKKYGVERSPSVLIAPERYSIRYTGAPLGEEGRSLIMTLIMVSTGKTLLSPESLKRLERLDQKRHVRVFVSPTCPYCPQQVLYATSAAVAMPRLVSAEVVEIYENRDLAEKYGAMSVPKTFVGEELTSPGLEPEESFIESIIEGKQVQYAPPADRQDLKDFDVVILGGGPAGLTAAIYTERSGLKSIVLESANVGGQVAITPVVENYPGFARIEGNALVDLMARQASEYTTILQGVGVQDIKQDKDGFRIQSTRGEFRARAVVLATGATHRTLNVPGERELAGRGVSYCATCDGYIFKDGKDVIVVGGGNSALTDALYLDSIGAHVSVVHRRDSFRAEERLKQSLEDRGIPVYLQSRLTRISGEKTVNSVTVEDINTAKTRHVKADGVFIAIGYKPNSELAGTLGLKVDKEGYITVDGAQRTSMPLVYAAGDVAGGVKQIAVATGQGSVAAISAFEDLANPYWKK